MSLKSHCPCDEKDAEGNHNCPYGAEYNGDCEYWCGAEEPSDDPSDWEENRDDEETAEDYFFNLEQGFNPYEGAYDYDC